MTQFQGKLAFGRTILEFKVPANTTSVQITGTTKMKGFLYAAVYDAKGLFRGKVLLEQPVKSLDIQPQQSGFGAIDGDIPGGTWIVMLYNLEGELTGKRTMQYQIDVGLNQPAQTSGVPLMPSVLTDHSITCDQEYTLKSESRWYKGDLHSHTCLSDGSNTLAAAKEIVESQGLEYFFFTEHNICHPALPVSQQCLFLPGVEITTALGHFNVHGATASLDLRQVSHNSPAVIEEGLSLTGSQQGSISINHPMMKPWHWQYDDLPLEKVSTFEVCCDPTWPTSPASSDAALTVLSEMWNCGHRIAAVGGSDSHLEPHERNPKATEPSIYGDPATFVFSQGLNGKGILDGLKNGHIYFERRCGLEFTINQGDFIPGNDTQGVPLQYQLRVIDTRCSYVAECIVDGLLAKRTALSSELTQIDIEPDYGWCRIDIRRIDQSGNKGELAGCINALYNGDREIFKKPCVETWGELMQRVELN